MAGSLLFVYGLLKPGRRPPRTMSRHWPDAVPGVLYDLGSWPAAVAVGSAESWIEGEVVEIDQAELASLDEFEGVAEGLYVRKHVTTRAGHQVWVYQYNQPLPPGARRIEQWP